MRRTSYLAVASAVLLVAVLTMVSSPVHFSQDVPERDVPERSGAAAVDDHGVYQILEIYTGIAISSRENLLLDTTTGRVWVLSKGRWVLMPRENLPDPQAIESKK